MSIWKKALNYFGLSEEDEVEEYEEVGDDTNSLYDEAFQPETRVKKIERREIVKDGEKDRDRDRIEAKGDVTRLRPVPKPSSRVHIFEPSIYNDVQQIGDKIKANIPVVVNLKYSKPDVSKRIIDFFSGLIYGLNGNIQKVGEKIFIITPENMIISESDKRKLREKGLYKPL